MKNSKEGHEAKRTRGKEIQKSPGFMGKIHSAIPHLATIRIKLILAFLVPIAFVIILGIVSFNNAAEGLRSSYEKSTQQAIKMTGDNIELGMASVESLSDQYIDDNIKLNYFMGLFDYDVHLKQRNLKIINSDISTKVKTDNFISQISILADTGSVTTLKGIKDNNLYTGFSETQRGKETNDSSKILWLGNDTYLDDNMGVGPEQYAMRLVRSFEGTKALIVIDMDMKAVSDILNHVDFDKTGTLALVTMDGKEIISGEAPSNTNAVFNDKEFYQKAVASDKASGADYVNYKGKNCLFMYSKIGTSGSMICAIIPKSTILRQADKIKEITVLIVIIACIIAILTGLFISFGIDRTIRSIIKKLKQAAAGDLTVDFTTKRKDEFSILIEEINHTFSNMKELIRQVKTLSEEVSGASLGVSQTSEEFLKTSGDISAAMDEIEQGVMQQAKDAQECLLQMDNLSDKIEQMSSSAVEIGKIAEGTKKSVQDGTVVTKELTSQTRQTIDITTDIVKGIEKLADKSMSINSIINVINDISNQTNLLSLNASIEAARAGEVGRGFAVVASEIRELAEQTKRSVNDIKGIIGNIQEDTKNVVKTAKDAENVMVLQDNAVNNTAQSYRLINESVDHLTDNLKTIIDNVTNIEGARASTLGAIENISAVLEQTAASTNNVSQISNSQLKSVETLNQSTGHLNQNSEQLVNAIQKFTV